MNFIIDVYISTVDNWIFAIVLEIMMSYKIYSNMINMVVLLKFQRNLKVKLQAVGILMHSMTVTGLQVVGHLFQQESRLK